MIWSRPVATNPPDIILETEIMATFGGRERNRTPNLLRAKELRSQLRHTPIMATRRGIDPLSLA